jgi:hypothetical protein
MRFVAHTGRAVSAEQGARSQLAGRALAILLVTSLGAGAALAADASLPNEPLHGVKRATEEIRLGLAGADQRVAVLLDIAEARLEEAAALEAGLRDAEAGAAVSAYAERVATAAAHVQEQATTFPAAAEQFRTDVRKQQAAIPGGVQGDASAVAIVLELRPTLLRDRQAAPHEIAAAAADVADKAAINVEQKVMPVAPDAAVRVVSSANVSGASPATSDPQVRVVIPTTPPQASSRGGHTTSAHVGATATQSSVDDAKKTEAAAKAARESADRAKQAAEQAKHSASKNGRDKGK